MTNTNATIAYNNGSPGFSPAAGVTNLNEDDTVTISLSGFPAGSSISTVKFFANSVVNGVDTKDTSDNFGTWTRTGGNNSGLSNIYSCSSSSFLNVEIEDKEDSDDDDKHWYSLDGVVGTTTTTWSVDPELINKGSA